MEQKKHTEVSTTIYAVALFREEGYSIIVEGHSIVVEGYSIVVEMSVFFCSISSFCCIEDTLMDTFYVIILHIQ